MFHKILTSVCVLAIALAAFGIDTDDAAAGGPWIPVFDDTLCATVTIGDIVYGPKVGILPAGHSLKSRLVAAGLRAAQDDDQETRDRFAGVARQLAENEAAITQELAQTETMLSSQIPG